MKKLTLFVLAGMLGFVHPLMAAEPATVSEPGFVSLFDGHSLNGWAGAVAMYGVDSGHLCCFPERPLPSGGLGNLVTERSYRNFILRFDVMMSENGNSGLGIRMVNPGADAAYEAMCEVQLLDDGGSHFFDRIARKPKLLPYQYTCSIYGIQAARRDNRKMLDDNGTPFVGNGSYSYQVGHWNAVEVRVAGTAIRVTLNGFRVIDTDVCALKGTGDTLDGKPHPGLHAPQGRIGWLGHGSHVRWRNIRLLELPDTATMADADRCAEPPADRAAPLKEQTKTL